MQIRFGEVRERLDEEALELFGQMVEAHLEAGRGNKIFLRVDSLAGCGLMFSSDDVRRDWNGFNGGSLDDLVGYGLLHRGSSSRGTENYRITADGVAFYQWLLTELGQPIEQVQAAVVSLVDSTGFASRQQTASHHLAEAFDLLRSDNLDVQRISELGDHLRKAIMDATTAVLGEGMPWWSPSTQSTYEQINLRLTRLHGCGSLGNRNVEESAEQLMTE